MAIDTSINNDTALQILGEIVNLLNNTPVALTPWISTPPYTDTKTDLLYEIWQALKNGSAGSGSVGSTGVITFQTNTNGLQGINLPESIMITNVVAKCSVSMVGVSLGVAAYPTLLLDNVDWDEFGMLGDVYKSFTPNVYIRSAVELFTSNSIPAGGLKITYIITYTVLPKI